MTNAEGIKSMTNEELARFLFNVEFIRTLAYPEGKTYGSFSTLRNWLEQEVTVNIKDSNAIREHQNEQYYKSLGVTKEDLNYLYEKLNKE